MLWSENGEPSVFLFYIARFSKNRSILLYKWYFCQTQPFSIGFSSDFSSQRWMFRIFWEPATQAASLCPAPFYLIKLLGLICSFKQGAPMAYRSLSTDVTDVKDAPPNSIEEIRRGFNSGSIDFLPKPVNSTSLSRSLNNILGGEQITSTGSVIILEDDPIIATLMKKMLAQVGLQSHRCQTIAEAENLLEFLIPDLITLDIQLIDGNAMDLCKKLRKRKDLDPMSIVIITGQNDTKTMIQSFESGANDFLTKPFTFEEFSARIKNQLRTKRLIDQLSEKSHELQGMAFCDGLTGLLNRHYLDSSIKREIEKATQSKTPLSVAMIDLDFFKKVNDNFGHSVGDVVLKEVAQIIKGCLRPLDIACRYGGEELCVLMPGLSPDQAAEVADQIRRSCEGQPLSEHNVHQTVSIGVSTYPTLSDESSLIANADDALYRSKKIGRNCVSVFS
jgi:two-component system cell cycle response regulator